METKYKWLNSGIDINLKNTRQTSCLFIFCCRQVVAAVTRQILISDSLSHLGKTLHTSFRCLMTFFMMTSHVATEQTATWYVLCPVYKLLLERGGSAYYAMLSAEATYYKKYPFFMSSNSKTIDTFLLWICSGKGG